MLKMDLEFNKGILFVRLWGRLLRNNCYKINPSEIQNPAELVDAALRNNKSKRDNGVIMVPFSAHYKQDLEKGLEEEYKKITEGEREEFGTY